jgi:hypothetical protein
MVERGRDYLLKVAEQLPEDQLSGGVEFLRAGVAAFERIHAQSSAGDDNPRSKPAAQVDRFPGISPENAYDAAD